MRDFVADVFRIIYIVLVVESVVFFLDLFFSDKPSNPVWDQGFNWASSVLAVFAGAVVGAALMAVFRAIYDARLQANIEHRNSPLAVWSRRGIVQADTEDDYRFRSTVPNN